MTRPRDYKAVQSHIRGKLSDGSIISHENRTLLRAVIKVTRKFEDNVVFNAQNVSYLRSLFKNHIISPDVVNELCLKLHLSLAYLIEDYDDERISQDAYLANIKEITHIIDNHFQGQDWSTLHEVLQYITASLFVATVVMLVVSVSPIATCTVISMLMACALSSAITEKYEFNHSIASTLTPFVGTVV